MTVSKLHLFIFLMVFTIVSSAQAGDVQVVNPIGSPVAASSTHGNVIDATVHTSTLHRVPVSEEAIEVYIANQYEGMPDTPTSTVDMKPERKVLPAQTDRRPDVKIYPVLENENRVQARSNPVAAPALTRATVTPVVTRSTVAPAAIRPVVTKAAQPMVGKHTPYASTFAAVPDSDAAIETYIAKQYGGVPDASAGRSAVHYKKAVVPTRMIQHPAVVTQQQEIQEPAFTIDASQPLEMDSRAEVKPARTITEMPRTSRQGAVVQPEPGTSRFTPFSATHREPGRADVVHQAKPVERDPITPSVRPSGEYQRSIASRNPLVSSNHPPVRALSATVDAYRLGAGDKFKIHVFGEDDLDVVERLGASGVIRYPFLGKVHVADMTIADVERMLADQLNGRYLINPQLRISMLEFRPFYLNGEVQRPGAYPYQPGLTIRKAISLGGGFTENADENKVSLIPAGDPDKLGHWTSLDDTVMPGDIVTVKKSYFFVNGEVLKPGKYAYQPTITYRMAISMAGGMRERADKDEMTVLHEGGGNAVEQIHSIDELVEPGDVITVMQSFF